LRLYFVINENLPPGHCPLLVSHWYCVFATDHPAARILRGCTNAFCRCYLEETTQL